MQVPGIDFPAAAVRDALRQAMNMGMPEAPEERITFRWSPDRTYGSADSSGNPWSWTDTPSSEEAPADVQVPAAIEFASRPAGSQDTPIGQFDTSRVTVTLLDEDFDQIRGADQIIIDGNRYEVQFVAPPVGLFQMTVYSVYAEAIDES